MSEIDIQIDPANVSEIDIQKIDQFVRSALSVAAILARFTKTTVDDDIVAALQKLASKPWFPELLAELANLLKLNPNPAHEQITAVLAKFAAR